MNLVTVAAREINIDGELHVTGACCVDAIMGHDCPKCGGTVHQQPVYHGIADYCENCDADAWSPFGTYDVDKDGFVTPGMLEEIIWQCDEGLMHLAWISRWRSAYGCGVAAYPKPVAVVDQEWPTCLECIAHTLSNRRFRQP